VHRKHVAELEVNDRLEGDLVERHHEEEERAPPRRDEECGEAHQHQGQSRRGRRRLHGAQDRAEPPDDAPRPYGLLARDPRT
jgi:hypothetical protein